MENFVKEHPKSTVIAFLVFLAALLQWLDVFGGVWSAFSSKPLFLALKEWWPTMTHELYWSLTLALRFGMLGLLVVIFFRVHQQRKEYELLEAERRKTAELQAELAVIKDKRPCLKAKPVLIRREIANEKQPQAHIGQGYRGGLGFFALLRITNEPENKNISIAYDSTATISYCDEKWNELPSFPPIKGAWVFPDHQQHHGIIGDVYEDYTPHLKPQHWAHLGIALRYPWGDQFQCYAFNASSLKSPDWLRKEFQLLDEIIYVKVTVSCNNFRETYRYILKNCGAEQGLTLEEVEEPKSPTPQRSRFWPLL